MLDIYGAPLARQDLLNHMRSARNARLAITPASCAGGSYRRQMAPRGPSPLSRTHLRPGLVAAVLRGCWLQWRNGLGITVMTSLAISR